MQMGATKHEAMSRPDRRTQELQNLGTALSQIVAALGFNSDCNPILGTAATSASSDSRHRAHAIGGFCRPALISRSKPV